MAAVRKERRRFGRGAAFAPRRVHFRARPARRGGLLRSAARAFFARFGLRATPALLFIFRIFTACAAPLRPVAAFCVFSCGFGPAFEGAAVYLELAGGAARGDFAVFPGGFDKFKFLWALFRPSAEANAAGERGGYTLGLALADEGALCLRDVAEELEHYVGDYDAGEVAALARVEQRHVEDDYFSLFFLREQPPLFEYLGVVAPEAVYAFDDEGVAAAELVDEALVAAAFEVFAGLAVEVDVFRWDAVFDHRGALAFFVLVSRGDADVGVLSAHFGFLP